MPVALQRQQARMRLLVPPGGFAGFAQQTPATQNLFQRAGRIGGKTTQRRRRKKNGKNGPARAKRARRAGVKRTSGRASRMTKGSAAAKRHMAKLRRMRKRK
jgi:hypothetical protein